MGLVRLVLPGRDALRARNPQPTGKISLRQAKGPSSAAQGGAIDPGSHTLEGSYFMPANGSEPRTRDPADQPPSGDNQVALG